MKTKFAAIVSVWMILAVAAAGQHIPPINLSHDPYQLYGGCVNNFSGYISKAGDAEIVGSTLAHVTAIDVLVCREFDGPGGGHEVPCPTGSPYTHCVEVDNDGLANHVLLGILDVTPDNDPLGQYGGCAPGAGFRASRSPLRCPTRASRFVFFASKSARGFPSSPQST